MIYHIKLKYKTILSLFLSLILTLILTLTLTLFLSHVKISYLMMIYNKVHDDCILFWSK